MLRALLNDGDEVLVPSPDYPLWTAAVNLNRGRAVHYPCRPENGFVPDPEEVARLITPRTRAIVVINPNNPTGAVYPRAVLEALARLAERARPRGVQRRDLRPDDLRRRRVRPDGDARARHAVRHALGPVEGLPRLRLSRRLGGVLRAHARRRRVSAARSSCSSSLRLCSNVLAQWAVQTALGGYQSIRELDRSRRAAVRVARGDPGGRRSAAAFCRLAPPTRRDVRLRRRRRGGRCRISTTSSSRSICSSRSTCWWPRA